MPPNRFRVRHRTEYQYGRPMADGFTMVHLAPRPSAHQTVESFQLVVTPQPDEWEDMADPFGNPVSRFAVHHPHDSLLIESELVVLAQVPDAVPWSPPWDDVARTVAGLRGDAAREVAPYLAHTEQTPVLAGLQHLTDAEFWPRRPVADVVSAICQHIFSEFVFDAGFSDVTTPLHTVLEQRRGVCQDFAHVGVSAIRSMGLPARYVSGYIETLPPPGQPKLVGVDASHAWCSVWCGEVGWLDFDPTNNQMPPMRHITVGWGRAYDDVAPVRGVVIGPGGDQQLHVAVDVAHLP